MDRMSFPACRRSTNLTGLRGVGFDGIGAPAGISADTVVTLNDTIERH